ncbi:translocation/assembly module TamB domain-containing protein [Pollutibacter soli]|uniref:translocation/assembly module TamB domain-containing protein n=1 Tax=Pollutibacter soli TaxID=3034157 RepID=UPI003013E98F
MPFNESKKIRVKTVLRRAGKVLLWIIGSLILLILIVLLLLQTPGVQNWAKDKAVGWLSRKLETKVAIGHLRVKFPTALELNNVYIEDRTEDTLLSARLIRADLNMWSFIHGDFSADLIRIQSVNSKIRRSLPDTQFNFQFIIDAFSSGTKDTSLSTTSKSPEFFLRKLELSDIRFIYTDVLSGNNFNARLDQAEIEKIGINPDSMNYKAPSISIHGLFAQLHQDDPLINTVTDIEEAADSSVPLTLGLREISLKDIHWRYQSAGQHMINTIDLNQLVLDIDKLDLSQNRIALNQFKLDSSAIVVKMGKAVKAVNPNTTEPKDSSTAPWIITAKDIDLTRNDIRYDDDNVKPVNNGIDYSHLDVKELAVKLKDFIFSSDSISGKMDSARLSEKSGLKIQQLHTDFAYTNTGAYLKDLDIQTPGTHISKEISARWPSIDALSKDIGLLNLHLDLDDTRVKNSDLLIFVPALAKQKMFRDRNATWSIDSRISGSLRRLDLPQVRLSGMNNTYVDLSGTAAMVMETEKMQLDLTIKNVRTSKRDLQLFLPDSTLPQNITVPEKISIAGKLRGGINKLFVDLNIDSDLGDAGVKGNLIQIRDSVKAVYDLSVYTRQLKLGTLIQNDSLFGEVTADFSVKGKGYVPATMNAELNGKIDSIDLKQYRYRDLALNGNITDQQFRAEATMQDPNLNFDLKAEGSVAGRLRFIADLNVDTLNAKALNLSTTPLVYKGALRADFNNVHPDSLDGHLELVNTSIANDSLRVFMDTMQLTAGFTDSAQFIRFASAPLHAGLEGTYKLTELGDVILQTIKPYFSVDGDSAVIVQPYDFTLYAKLIDHPILHSITPDLNRLDSITINGRLKSETAPELHMRMPRLLYDSILLSDLRMDAGADKDSLRVDISMERLSAGTIQMYRTDIRSAIDSNTINTSVATKDKAGKDRYRFGTKIATPEKGLLAFSIRPEPIMLNYKTWYMNDGNNILYSSKGINIDRFVLTRNNEELSINSYSDTFNAPIDVSFQSFEVSTLMNIIQQDTVTIDGQITGRALLMNLLRQPMFTSDLKVENLAFSKDTLGTLALKVRNEEANLFKADITLSGEGNDVAVTGDYQVVPGGEGKLNLDADFRAIQLSTLEGVTQRMIRDARGYLNGKLKIAGTLSDPSVDGKLLFNETRFNLGLLNSYFSLDKQGIDFTDRGVELKNFTINDSTGNKAILNGIAFTDDYRNYRFDLALNADDFKAMNTSKKDNKLYYGQVNFDARLTIKGTATAPAVDGSITINKNTSLTVVLPSAEPGIEQREGVVRFLDMDSVRIDSSYKILADTMAMTELQGMDINVNISINKEAILTLVVDEGNGDYLRMKGEGQLSGAIDPGGELTLAGSYEISEGTYELTFNFIKRKFDINSGSKIIWKGQATEADVDITAVYKVDSSPLDLVENQLEGVDATLRNTYRQKLPFRVSLIMKGELMKPDISFDITLPENDNITVGKEVVQTVQDKLELIRREPSELNKQVFALLLLKRFVSETPFQASTAGSAESFARTSVSKILTDQLNQLAASLVQGVDVNFDVASTEDYTTGRRQNRTDLNVELSKRLLNDRLTVTVGSNFELEGVQGSNQRSTNVAGNISLNYALSQDGRYMIRGYRKNVYEGILEGYIIETGLGFIITVDYNKFRQVFMSQKAKEKRRAERRKAREQKKELSEGL